MLLVAHDGAKIDSHDHTLIQRNDASPDSSTEFLSFGMWDKDLYETLEHYAGKTLVDNIVVIASDVDAD